jgi:hypothetical protein
MLWMLDEAFRDNPWHSSKSNMRSLREDDWEWLADGAQRSILHIVQHVGYCNLVYENQAFGDRTITWDDAAHLPATTAPDVMADWLRASQQTLRDSVAALQDDDDLLQLRRNPWGTESPTRWIVNNMIQHNLYHLGEINHMRALHQRNDE